MASAPGGELLPVQARFAARAARQGHSPRWPRAESVVHPEFIRGAPAFEQSCPGTIFIPLGMVAR